MRKENRRLNAKKTLPTRAGRAGRSSRCGRHACSPEQTKILFWSKKSDNILWFACQALVWQSRAEHGRGESPSARERWGCCSFDPGGQTSSFGQIGLWANYCTLEKGSDVMDFTSAIVLSQPLYMSFGCYCIDALQVIRSLQWWKICAVDFSFHLVRDRDGAIDVDQIPLDLDIDKRGLANKTMQDKR